MTSRKDLSVSERIAALRRGSSPQPQGGARLASPPPGTPPTLASSHSLKDKIAHFDALGSAPKPVGSFSHGGSLGPEHRHVSRELYGNRIPSVSHKIGRSVSGGKDLLQAASSSTSSFDRDVLTYSNPGSTHSGEASEENRVASSPTGSGQESLSVRDGVGAVVPEIRRNDSMTERWVDTLQSKPTISLDTGGSAGVFAPPSPVPDFEDAQAPSGPITPLTTTLISHLGALSHTHSRLGHETPMSVMVETGSLADGEQPRLVPDDETVPVPSSPVVTGMQALGFSDGELAEGETTPTREDEPPKGLLSPTSSLALHSTPAVPDESPNTPLARSVEVEGPIAPVQLGGDSQTSGLGVSTGGLTQQQGSRLTATNVHQLDEQSRLAPPLGGPSGPSSVLVEDGSVSYSPSPSPAPQQGPGTHTPEPASALTPKQSVSDLPPLAQGSVPLSAATLRLLDIEGGKKGGSRLGGTETPMSMLVETGSTDSKPRDLEGVDPPTATPAPASPASDFEEPESGAVVPPDQRADGSETKDIPSSVEIANSEPDNRSSERGPSVPLKNIPTIITNIQEPPEDVASPTMKTPTNKKGASLPAPNPTASSRTIQKSRSRPNLSTTSTDSAPAASSQTLAAPNSGLQRRATTGSNDPKTTQRRRVSRVPQMQLLPSGQWGVVDDDSEDEEDTGGWAKVIVSKSRWS